MSTIGERLKLERERLGLSQTAFAAIGGAGKHSQINYETDRRAPDTNYISALAQAGVDILYLVTGIRKTPGSPLDLAERASKMVQDIAGSPAPDVKEVDFPQAYAVIALHEASLSAGPGVSNGGSNIVDHLAFRRDWLHRIGVNPEQACLARVCGDSMLPTLSSGDMVLIDTAKREVPIRPRTEKDRRRSAIYAFVEAGEARIKRVERPEKDLLLLLSDNPDFSPETRAGGQLVDMQMAIIGKVVWWGHTAPV